MKKILSVLIGVLLLASIGFAVEPGKAPQRFDEETVRQAAVMDTPAGTEARFMQLEKAMAENVIMGQRALEVMLEKNPEANTTELERVVAELEVIKEEIEEKLQMDDFQGKEASELIEEFAIMKEEGRNLSNEFRESANEYLDEEDRLQIREEARQRADEEIGEKRQQIQEKIREQNAEQVERVLERMGTQDPELVEQVRNGEINPGEAISQVAREFRGLSEERSQEFRVQTNVERSERAENAQEAVGRARENMELMMNERASERMEKVEDKLFQVRERIKENIPEQAKANLEERMGSPERDQRNLPINNEEDKKGE